VGSRDRGQADGRCADHIELAGDLAAEPVGDIDIRQGEERARLLKTVEFDPKLGASDGAESPTESRYRESNQLTASSNVKLGKAVLSESRTSRLTVMRVESTDESDGSGIHLL